MERKIKILKAVLLLRRFDRYESKEKQIAETEANYTDQQLDELIESLKNEELGPGPDDYPDDYFGQGRQYTTSCIGIDFSPSNPWDAPGMCIRDFI